MPKVTSEDLEKNFHLLRTAPEKYLALAEELVRTDPKCADGYWARYQAYDSLKKHALALADLDRVLTADRQWIVYECRGNTLRALGRYREALEDFNRAEAADPEEWNGGFGHLSVPNVMLV